MMKKLLFLILLISSLSAKELEKVSLQLQWLDQFQFAGYYIAKEKGFYEDVGLDVEIKKFKKGLCIVSEVTKNRSTYGVGRSSLLISKSRGRPVVMLASIFQSSPLILLAVDPTIKSIQDIQDKRVMVTPDAATTASIRAMMSQQKLYKSDFIEQKHSFNLNDLIDGKTDLMASYISNEPFRLQEKGIKYKIFDPKDYGFDFYSDILFTSEYEILNNSQRVENFKKASLKGWEYAFENIEESVSIIFSKYNIQNKSKKELLYEAKALKKLAYYNTNKIGKISKKKIQRIYDLYNVMGLIDTTVNKNSVVYNSTCSINFTPQESNYLKNHPTLYVHNDSSFKPINFNYNGTPLGYSVDLMNLLGDKIGVDIQYIHGQTWSEFVEMIKRDKLDVMLNIVKTKEREKSLSFTKPYKEYYDTIFSKENKPINSLKDLRGKVLAEVKGFVRIEQIRKKYPSIQILEFDKIEDVFKAVSYGQADALISIKPIAQSIMQELSIKNIVPTGEIFDEDGQASIKKFSLATSKQNSILRDILQKGLNNISYEEFQKIEDRWITSKNSYQQKDFYNKLTPKETEYLKDKKKINLCVDPKWLPFEGIEDDKHVGLSAEYFAKFENQIKIPIKLITTQSWNESLENVRKRVCDIVSLVMETEDKKRYMNFTKPYLEVPLILVTQPKEPFFNDFSQLKKKKIGIVQSYSYNKIIQQNYPYIELVTVSSIEEGLDMVANGKIYGFIDTLATVGYIFQKKFAGELKVSGQFDEKWELGVGVRSDDKVLLEIFKKLIYNIDPIEYKNTLNKYISTKINKVVDYSLIWQLVLLFLLVILAFIFRQKQLNKFNDKLKEKIEEKTKDLKYAQKLAKIGSWHLSLETMQLTFSDESYEIFEIDKKEYPKLFLQDFTQLVSLKSNTLFFNIDNSEFLEENRYRNTHEINTKDNKSKYIEELYEIVYDEDNLPQNLLGSIQDITEKKRAEIALKEKSEQLLYQSKFAQMGEMLSMIAHQWRQPLTAISATTSNLKIKTLINDVEKDFFIQEINLIEGYTQHLSATIDDFRSFFKSDKEKTMTSLTTIVKSTLNIVKSSLESKNITLISEFLYDEEIPIYKNEIKQVILNIIKNSEDALVENNVHNGWIKIKTYQEENKHFVEFSDNAGGINKEIINKIFEPYFSTKQEQDGTGLGLHMSKLIVEEHCKGKIAVKNSKEGVVFTVSFDM